MKNTEKLIENAAEIITEKTRRKLKRNECLDIGKIRRKTTKMVSCKCLNCNHNFVITLSKFNIKKSNGNEPKYCNRNCYINHSKSSGTRNIDIKKIIDLYLSGKSSNQIAKSFRKSPFFIKRILKNNNISLKDHRKIPPNKGDVIMDMIFLSERLEESDSGRKDFIWKMKCNCGNIFESTKNAINSKRTRSCGCFHKKSVSNEWGESGKNRLIKEYKSGAKRRNIKFNLTREQFLLITSQNCFYCGDLPNKKSYGYSSKTGYYLYNGIDRIDSNKDYSTDNCVPCCKKCNMAKMQLTHDEFLDMIKKIYLKHCS